MGTIIHTADKNLGQILDFWLNEPNDKRTLVNLYVAKFLCEVTTDKAKKKALNKIIIEIESTQTEKNDTDTSPEYVAYTTDGKGLTKQEYKDHVLEICDDIDNGKNLISHKKVFSKFEKKYKEYESNLDKKSK